MIYIQVLSYRHVLMTVLYLMTQVPVKSHTIQNLLFRSQMYTHLFGTMCKTCLERIYILKLNYTLVEEIGFFGSKKMLTMHLAGNFFRTPSTTVGKHRQAQGQAVEVRILTAV